VTTVTGDCTLPPATSENRSVESESGLQQIR
jgi:hypothetical protein